MPFLLRQRPDLTVVGSRFTLALVAAKCREHRLTPHLLEVKEGSRLRHGSWDCEYFAVNHSIPDALAVAIRTPAGLVLHTGDIKLDQLPLDGRLTDLAGFSRLGDEGVDLFLVDSTNADQPGFVISEGEIGPVLDGMFHRAGARIIVACFASHVHRVQQVLDAAAAHGRQVCFVGRSMVRNMGLAAEMGYLTVPPACWSSRTTRRAARTTASSTSPPVRRASRCPRSPGWRAATTGPCGSSPRTP